MWKLLSPNKQTVIEVNNHELFIRLILFGWVLTDLPVTESGNWITTLPGPRHPYRIDLPPRFASPEEIASAGKQGRHEPGHRGPDKRPRRKSGAYAPKIKPPAA